MSDGSEFSLDLGVTGGSEAASAADAIEALASKLELAGTAATAASDAMKAGQAAYDQAANAANRASLAVEKIGASADAQRGKLKAAMDAGDAAAAERAAGTLARLTARQAEAVTKAAAATAAMNAEAVALDKLKASAGAAETAEKNLNKQHDAAKKSLAANEKATKDAETAQAKSVGTAGALEGAFGKLGGPLGAIGQKVSGVAGSFLKMGKSLGDAGPYVAVAVAIVAIVAAIAAATAAAIAATVAIGVWAVGLADAARTQGLLAAGVAGTVKGGQQLEATIAKLGNVVPQTSDELLAMAGDLRKTGLEGDALSSALEEAAIKAAKLKFGPDFAKQMLSLPSQTARLKANFNGLFAGLKIDALLEALSKLVGLFDKTSATGNAIKVVFESLFQPLIDGVTSFVPKMVTAFIQFEILVLKALISIKPLGSKLLAVAEACGILAVIITAVLVAGTLLLIGALVLLTLPLIAVISLLVYFYDEIDAAGMAVVAFENSVVSALNAAGDAITGFETSIVAFFGGLSLADMGTDLIQGLVDGITAAGPKVLAAITGVATGAITAAKKALGIASPSTVFAEIGMHTAAGMEEGVDGGAAGVQGSMESLVAPPDATGGGSTATGGGAGATYYVTVQGGGDAQSNVTAFREWLASIGAQAGTAVPSVV